MNAGPPMVLFTAQTPGDLWAFVNTAVLFLAPGIGLGIAAARRLRLGWAAAVSGAFVFSSALAAVVMLVGTWLRLPLAAGTAAWLALAAVATVGAWFLGRGTPQLESDWSGLVIAGISAVTALVTRPWFKVSADTFYHLAAARSLLVRDALTVTDPFHGTATTVADPSSGVLHTMLAMLSRLRHMDIALLWTGLNIVGAIVLVLAFFALAKRLAHSEWAAAAGTLGFAVFNQFADFRAAAYPNRISIAIVFFGLMALTELLDRPSKTAAGVALAAGVAVCAMHVGNAEFYVLMALALAFWALVDGVVAKWREGRIALDGFYAMAVVLLVTGIAAVPLILPKFGVVSGSSMVDTAAAVSRLDLFQMGPFVVTRPGRFFDGGSLPFVLTTALALFMAGWSFVRRDRTGLAAFAFCSLPVLLLFDPPVTTLAVRFSFYNLARISALLGFTTYLAIAWALARPKGHGGRSQALFLSSIAFVAMAAISVPYLQTTWTNTVGAVRRGMNVSVWRSRQADIRNSWGPKALGRVAAKLDDAYPVIAADPGTGYYFAGFVTVRLVAVPRSHSPLAVEVVDGRQRRDDMAALLRSTAGQEERRAILERWHADYVVLWLARESEAAAAASMLPQTGLFEVFDSSKKLLVLKVVR